VTLAMRAAVSAFDCVPRREFGNKMGAKTFSNTATGSAGMTVGTKKTNLPRAVEKRRVRGSGWSEGGTE
jgi:hypothetical protein